MRHVGIAAIVAIVLVIMLTGLAAADAVSWSNFFAEGVQVEAFEDGSGRAVNAEGQLLFFCVQGYPCDHSIEVDAAIYLPLVSK